ncbi:hypothetical protein SESBI_10073 [Sesbania bispinosa]|nr:hypothetical protein SESBI_10073 [Sesbania bispinosa]
MWEEHPEVDDVIKEVWGEIADGENCWDIWRKKSREMHYKTKSLAQKNFYEVRGAFMHSLTGLTSSAKQIGWPRGPSQNSGDQRGN